MTQIVGTIKDSSGLLSGKLVVKLSAPLVDSTTSPNTVSLPISQPFTITNGAVNITLPESETAGISYEFTFNTTATVYEYYRVDGTQYSGPTHQHTDTYYYTGSYHDTGSVRLSRQSTEVLTPVDSFVTIVPNVASCEYSELLPTNFSRDRLPSGARQIANLIAFDVDYQAVLGEAIFSYKGDYSSDAWYKPRNWVSYAGSSWYSKYPNPHQGNAPATGSPYWALMADKGNAGGTGGQDTAYDATGWNNAVWAPSANVLRDKIETLATQAQLTAYAPLASPALTGNPTATTQATGNRSNRLATTSFVGAEIDLLGVVPVGAVLAWVTNSAPSKWLLCDGRTVSRTVYAALFALVSTTFGAGNGTTTFNLPDLRGRSLFMADSSTLQGAANRITTGAATLAGVGGSERVTLTTNEIPDINPPALNTYFAQYGSGGGFVVSNTAGSIHGLANLTRGGGQSHQNMPPYLVLNWIIYTGV